MKWILIATLLLSSSLSFADKNDDLKNVKECLKNWKTHPFNKKKPKYRTIESSVSVLGIGGKISDSEETKKPKLIYIKPSVNVLSKSTMELLNPNGWYCLKSKVSVLGKSIIKLCKGTHFTLSNEGAAVLGSNDDKAKGTTVLGAAKVIREDCE